MTFDRTTRLLVIDLANADLPPRTISTGFGDDTLQRLVGALRTGVATGPAVAAPVVEAIRSHGLRLLANGAGRHVSALPEFRLRKVVHLVEEQLEGPVTLADMARAAGISAYHFTRTFKAATGLTPQAYVRSCRLSRAKELIEQSPMPLAEVAVACGFASQAHMTTAFRMQFGQTPGRCRAAGLFGLDGNGAPLPIDQEPACRARTVPGAPG